MTAEGSRRADADAGAGMPGGIPVYRSAAVRAADRRAVDLGIAGMTLMERAGAGAWRVIQERLLAPPVPVGKPGAAAGPAVGKPGAAEGPTTTATTAGSGAARRILVLAGRGNNGGDGFVVARLAHQQGYPVTAVLLGRPDELRGDAAEACRRAREAGVEIVPLDPEESAAALARRLAPRLQDAFLVVDALLGTGSRGAPRAGWAAAIEATNRWRDRGAGDAASPPARVVALDLPSGLDPDTGWADGAVVHADLTVTFGALKTGLLMGPAARFTGPVHVVDIGLPPAAFPAPDAHLVTPARVQHDLPPVDPDAHKGSRGRVLVAAGSRGMVGAAVLAARGALRGGAGLVTVAVPAGERPLAAAAVPEALTLALPEDEAGRLDHGAAAVLRAATPAPDALVLGPGLGCSAGVAAAVLDLLGEIAVPIVLDADGLNALAAAAGGRGGGLQQVARGPGPRVLTPHPGEAARLLGATTQEVQRDRPAAARELARRSGAVVLLKGARSLVAEPAGDLWIIPTGSPALATGGTGDVLAGLIGALLAAGLTPVQAARAGAFLHGWAGQRLARRLGAFGVLAGDLPLAVARARAGLAARGFDDRTFWNACGILLEEAGEQRG